MAEKVTFAGHLGELVASHNTKSKTRTNLSANLRSKTELVARYKDVMLTTLVGYARSRRQRPDVPWRPWCVHMHLLIQGVFYSLFSFESSLVYVQSATDFFFGHVFH
jgi:hypothetical protein